MRLPFDPTRPTRPHRLRKTLCFVFLIAFFLWALPQIWIQLDTKSARKSRMEDLPVSEVILVLGARVYPDHPSQMLQERLDEAIRLYQAERAPYILVSGAAPDAQSDEPAIMKNYLIQQGIPESAILTDSQGWNTWQSMYRCRNTFGFQHILVATTSYHMSRSLFLARHLGLDAYGMGAPNREEYNMVFNFLRESLAQGKAWINVYLFAPQTASSQ